MSATSAIEWTDRTWNSVRGCSVVSPGCAHCYAMKQAHRFSGPGKAYAGLTKLTSAGPQWTGQVRLIKDALPEPLRWRTPSRVFVNSMSDLFHEDVPDEFIDQVFAVMALCPQHTFQVLTKRPERMRDYVNALTMSAERLESLYLDMDHVGSTGGVSETRRDELVDRAVDHWPLPNVWLGVSVEDQARADERIPRLLQTRAAIRFVSCEPLLGPLRLADACYANMDYESRMTVCDRDLALEWVIVGGESGSGARRCDLRWVRDLVRDCHTAHVPVFVKQLGARPDGWWPTFPLNRHAVRDPKGGNIAEWPEDLRVREYPEMAGAIANDGQG